MRYTTVGSAIGELLLAGDERGLARLDYSPFRIDPEWEPDPAPFEAVRAQLNQYFAGTRRDFDLDLALTGNAFELAVWNALLAIPYGQTATYGADGSLTGYGGGLDRKRFLLDLESGVLPLSA